MINNTILHGLIAALYSDNVVADSGSGGATFASDTVNGVEYPRNKLIHGEDGVNDGDVSTANPLPVDIRKLGGLAVATLGTTAYTEATTKGLVIGAVRNDTLAALANTDNEIAPLQVNALGALYISVDGTVTVGSHAVTNAGTFAVQEDGAALTALQLSDDVVATLGTTTYTEATTKGNVVGAVRNDTLATLANTDNEIAPLQVNASGALYTDVTAVVPGTGATSLGKAIDSPVGSADTGVAMLAVHTGEASKLAVAEEDYDHLHISELGALYTEPEQHNHLDEMDVTTGWTALGNDTLNLATTTNHLTGTNALTFDKVDGAANTVIAGIQKTITSVDMGEFDLHDIVQTVCYLSSIANVAYVFVRVGTDSTNYNEWRVADTELTAGDFIVLGLPVGSASQTGNTGNGVRWDDIKYIAVGVAFDNQNNTLSGIIFDQIGVFTASHNSTNITAEVSSSVSTPNVNILKIGGSVVDKNSGNVSAGSQRITIATDDVNQSAIKTAVELIDNAVSGSGFNVTQLNGVNVTMGNGASGTGVQRVTIASDTTGILSVDDNGGSLTIDNADITTIAGAVSGSEMQVDIVTDQPLDRLTDNVGVAIQTDVLLDDTTALTPKFAAITASGSGNNTLVTAVSGKKIRVLEINFVVASAVTVRIEDGADGTALTGQQEFAANSGISLPYCPVGLYETTANTLLNMELSSAVSVAGSLVYVEV